MFTVLCFCFVNWTLWEQGRRFTKVTEAVGAVRLSAPSVAITLFSTDFHIRFRKDDCPLRGCVSWNEHTALRVRFDVGEFSVACPIAVTSSVETVAQERSCCECGLLLHFKRAFMVTKLETERNWWRNVWYHEKALCVQGVGKFLMSIETIILLGPNHITMIFINCTVICQSNIIIWWILRGREWTTRHVEGVGEMVVSREVERKIPVEWDWRWVGGNISHGDQSLLGCDGLQFGRWRNLRPLSGRHHGVTAQNTVISDLIRKVTGWDLDRDTDCSDWHADVWIKPRIWPRSLPSTAFPIQ